MIALEVSKLHSLNKNAFKGRASPWDNREASLEHSPSIYLFNQKPARGAGRDEHPLKAEPATSPGCQELLKLW